MDRFSGDFRSSINQMEAERQAVLASNLSPHAPEFVPRFTVNVTSNGFAQQPIHPLESNANVSPAYRYAFANGHSHEANDYGQSIDVSNNVVGSNGPPMVSSEEDSEADDYVALNELKEFIDTISSNPAEYEHLLPYITDVLNNYVSEDPDIILECVVNNIVDQAILDNNFSYNGVRLCLHLVKNLTVASSKGPFKTLLVKRCQREHARRVALATASDGGTYLRGLTLFIADLCTKLNEPEILTAVPDLLQSLLGQSSIENIKTSCQVLKLCGFFVDTYLNQISSNSMDELFEKLNQIKSRTENAGVQALIKSVEEARERKWYSNTAPSACNGTEVSSAPSFPAENGHPNGFGPDMQGYDFGPCGDEDNEDVCDAFEEFLRASGQIN